MVLHPFVVPFGVIAAATAVILAMAALIRTSLAPQQPLALHVLATWALVVIVANAANAMSLTAGMVLLMVVVAGVAIVLASGTPLGPAAIRRTLAGQRQEIGVLMLVWIGYVVVL